MPYARRTVVFAVFAVLAALAAAVLYRVLGTVIFAATVAYVLAPVYRRLESRVPAWWAAAGTATLAAVAVLVPALALVNLLYTRSADLVAFVGALPSTFTLAAAGFTYTVDLSALTPTLVAAIRGLAVAVAAALPALGVKLTLFGVLLFGLLMAHERAEAAVIAAVPLRFHDVVDALAHRTKDTLYAIYVLQAVTGVATALVAIPVFWALGYDYFLLLAAVCGVLQFLPIVGPSIVVAALALYRVSVGDVAGAVLVAVLAGALVAWLPDPLIRPRLSRRTANLPGSLYFVGFTGGILTLGPIGVIAGPLVVALLVESVHLLAEEERTYRA
ncbi:MAG: AI-2E family transporter [Halarchaeum sp.]